MVGQPGFTANSVVLAAPVLGLGSIGWVPGGLGVVDGEEIPYQPWAEKRKKENLEHWMDRAPCTCRIRFRSSRARPRS
jgi:hypothetical protein